MAWTGVFSRIFDEASYGRYSLSFSVAVFLTALSSQWLQQATNRYLTAASRPETLRLLKGAVMAGVLVIAGVVTAVGMLLLIPIGMGEWRPYVVAGGAVWLATAVYSPLLVVLQAELRSGTYTVYHVAHVVLRFGLALGLVLVVSRHASGLLWGGALAVALILPALVRSLDLPGPGWVWNRRRRMARMLRLMAGYGIPMAGWWLAATLLNVGDRWVIQWARGAGEVGIYSANYQLVTGATGLLATPVLLAAHPLLMRSWGRDDRERTGEWIAAAVQLILIVGAILAGIVSVFSGDIARLLLGERFHEGYLVMPLVLMGLVAWQSGMYTHKPLEFLGRTRLLFGLGMATAALNLLLNVLFIPRFGYMAAAATTTGSYAAYAVVTTASGRRLLAWRLPWPSLLLVLGAILALFAATAAARAALVPAWGYWPATISVGALGIGAAGALGFLYLARMLRRLEA